MTASGQWLRTLAGVLAGVLVVAGCSLKTKQEWLTFFFDGVPEGS